MRIDGPNHTDTLQDEQVVAGARTAGEAAAMLDLIQDEARFDRQWLADDLAYPGDHKLWEVRVRRLLKRRDFDSAVALIDQRSFGEPDDPRAIMAKAEWLFTAHQAERATAMYEELLACQPDAIDVRLGFAKRQFTNGLLVRAHCLLMPIADRLGTDDGADLWLKVSNLFDLLGTLEQGDLDQDQDCRILAMKHAILHFRGRELRPVEPGDLGRLCLITGSLGPGGAERQLSRLAIELDRARREQGAVGPHTLSRPVQVVVRSHGPEQQHDFYLQDVLDGDVELHQLDLFEAHTPKKLGITDPVLRTLLDYLPPSVNHGVRRLTKHLVDSGTDVMSAWQDGACLFAGLPALLAGVPNIQFTIRGLPPSVRKHMFRPEYEVLYRAMAEVPGVSFVSNNHSAAKAYADWLAIDQERFSVVFNGVPPMTSDCDRFSEQMWEAFRAKTADAQHTIGGVFRFDTDKQPNLWIRFAARYLKKYPETRFVLVGGGRLLGGARDLAEELGIAHRILFTDRSVCVGYWMAKMDALVLLSRYEGLPNVLIEAQYMGVPVVTTPAGGAAECLIDGLTGHVLDCCEKPTMEQIVERTHSLVAAPVDPGLFQPGGQGREFLDRHFSIANMLESYVRCTVGSSLPVPATKGARRAA